MLATLGFVLSSMLLWGIVGGRVLVWTQTPLIWREPVQAAVTGMGLWAVWLAVWVVWWGVPIALALAGFLALGIGAIVLLWVQPGGWPRHEHTWTPLLLAVAVGSVWLMGWVPDTLQLPEELWGSAKNLAVVQATGQWADRTAWLHYGLDAVAAAPGLNALLLPFTWWQGNVMQLAAPMNGVLLMMLAWLLMRQAGVAVKWSNLPLVVGGCLLGVTLLNPFFNPTLATALVPDLLIAVALMVAVVPLYQRTPLPQGIAVVPQALALALMSMGHHLAFLLALCIGCWWLMRGLLVEGHNLAWADIAGWAILFLLPVSVHLAHQVALAQAGVYLAGGWLLTGHSPLTVVHEAALLLVVGWIGALGVKRLLLSEHYGGMRRVMLHQGVWVLPVLAVVSSVGLYALFLMDQPLTSLFRLLGWWQGVLLIPVWVLWRQWYQTSALEKWSYRAPWSIGLALLAILMFGQLALLPQIHKPKVRVNHGLSVAQMVMKQDLSPPQAVVGAVSLNPTGTAALSYGLRQHAPVLDVTPLFYQAQINREQLHQALRQQGVAYVWIHVPDITVQKVLSSQLQPQQSYLFALTPKRFRLIEAFPHLSYTTAY